MQADITTLYDLSILHHHEEHSVFHQLNFTQTNNGREYLKQILCKPLDSIEAITDKQQTIQHLQTVAHQWTKKITNGRIMVLEKFFETPTTSHSSHPSLFDALYFKAIYKHDFQLIQYSTEHCIGFIQGLQEVAYLLKDGKSKELQIWNSKIELLLQKPIIQQMLSCTKTEDVSARQFMTYGYFIRHSFKHDCLQLIELYSKIDAYLSLAKAALHYQFNFPEFIETDNPFLQAKGLFHLQLNDAVSYEISLTKAHNFMFLTGANMAGKSTFIKAVGVATYLAHIGMPVPAKYMQLSCFDGILSNIQVEDNLMEGESYFYNEVKRVKTTVEAISNGKKWLVLIDELFKGTNLEDAMKCSTTVIEGLRNMNNAIFILSTHLYEIGNHLKQYSNIQFQYFETSIQDDELIFSYQLKEGISNDRLGYLILKREGVVEMLERFSR